MRSKIFLSSPHMGGQEHQLVLEAFATNWIAPLGPQVDAFEKEFAETLALVTEAEDRDQSSEIRSQRPEVGGRILPTDLWPPTSDL
ncbi:MAG: hypothetical protein FJ399_07695 [Verrucomicrobia bacterium]|nr:hypothetical protein [Verrucomicrobiota bacterium]